MTDAPITDGIAQSLNLQGVKGVITGWVMAAEFMDEDGDHCWIFSTPDEQRISTTLGLVQLARGQADLLQQDALYPLGDDDEGDGDCG